MNYTISKKLAAKYFGIFHIISVVGPVAYRLQLPPKSKLHPVFLISQLKRIIGQHLVLTKTLKGLETMKDNCEHEAILENRIQSDQDQLVPQLLVKWKIRKSKDACWMNYFDFVNQFPDFRFGDKVVPNGDGIVIDEIMNPGPKAILLRVYYKKQFRNNKTRTDESAKRGHLAEY